MITAKLDTDACILEPREVYDKAIIGVTDDGRAIYSAEEVIHLAVPEIFDNEEEAREWHEHYTFCASWGDMSPVYVDLR